MNTNYTYRFVTVAEQVLTMIGEGKHGLWRVQESGVIREYLRAGAEGLPAGADPLEPGNLAILRRDYAAHLPGESWDGYKFPDQAISAAGRMNFVDLPISHPKYEGRYADEPPIDLANWFCTMSGPDYPYARRAIDFAFAQAAEGEIGPLGRRAGLGVKENYPRVLQLSHLPDARSWVNVPGGDGDEIRVQWEAVDTTRTQAEYYLVERPFFNVPYLFLIAVFDQPELGDFRYVRPDGPYFEHLAERSEPIKTDVTHKPRFAIEGGGQAEAQGLPLYGVHHPNRAAFGGGGACPMKGGDWGRYPDPSGGSGWPTQYEEITPLCDAVLVDIKFYANLDGKSWNDPNKYLANAGTGSETIEYTVQPGDYGAFATAYNVDRGVENPDRRTIPDRIRVRFPAVQSPVGYERPATPDRKADMLPLTSTSCRPVRG